MKPTSLLVAIQASSNSSFLWIAPCVYVLAVLNINSLNTKGVHACMHTQPITPFMHRVIYCVQKCVDQSQLDDVCIWERGRGEWRVEGGRWEGGRGREGGGGSTCKGSIRKMESVIQ